jgi:hypothetical protein
MGNCFLIPEGPLPAHYMQIITTSTTTNMGKLKTLNLRKLSAGSVL